MNPLSDSSLIDLTTVPHAARTARKIRNTLTGGEGSFNRVPITATINVISVRKISMAILSSNKAAQPKTLNSFSRRHRQTNEARQKAPSGSGRSEALATDPEPRPARMQQFFPPEFDYRFAL